MSDYFTYTNLVANTLARASDVNTRFQAVAAGFDMLPAPVKLQQGRITYGPAAGTANALTFAMTPTLAAYVEGLHVRLKIAATNSAAATINIDGLGAKSIKRADGTALAAADLAAGTIVDLVYDGTNFRLMRPVGVDSTVTPASILTALLTVDGSGSGLDADLLRGTTPTTFGLSLIDDANAAAGRTTLGLGTIATQNAASVAITGGSIAGITDLAVADGGTGASTAATARTNLGLGSIATQASSSVSITGGTISGITDLAVADGGTGASTAAAARTNLGLVIGTNVQAQDAELQAIAGLASAADRVPYFTGAGTAALATFTAFGRSLVDDVDATAGRSTLGLGTMATETAANYLPLTAGASKVLTDMLHAGGSQAEKLRMVGADAPFIAGYDIAGTTRRGYLQFTAASGSFTHELGPVLLRPNNSTILTASSTGVAIIGTLSTTGNCTLGDASTDSHTVNGDLSVTSGLSVAGNSTCLNLFVGQIFIESGTPRISLTDDNGTGASSFGDIRFSDQTGAVQALITKATSGDLEITCQFGNIELKEGVATRAATTANGLSVTSTTTASAANVHLAVGTLSEFLRSTSSRRYKKAITDLDDAEAALVLALRSVTYKSKAAADDPDRLHWGFVAEEADPILPCLVNYDEQGRPDGFQYERVTVGLVSVARRHEERLARLEELLQP